MITIDREAIEAIETAEGLPEFVHCTPTRGGERVLPTKTAPTSGIIQWTWKPVSRRDTVDGALIRIGTWARNFPLSGGTVDLIPGDYLILEARLADLRI